VNDRPIDSSTIGPMVIGWTNWPSPTSNWRYAPAAHQILELFAELEKSAA